MESPMETTSQERPQDTLHLYVNPYASQLTAGLLHQLAQHYTRYGRLV